MDKNNRGIRALGMSGWELPAGERNMITDVEGVRVGQVTKEGVSENGLSHHTGVTVIIPAEDNIFLNKMVGASYVLNGYGKTTGLVQVDELGTLETPIALTNTLNVGIVADGLVEYTIRQCAKDDFKVRSVNPVVGETNDSMINEIRERIVTQEDVLTAIENASKEVEEGCVGAGAGTVCFGLKGGIGTASRLVEIGEKTYTVGVLVQSNFGSTRHLMIGGKPVGREIAGTLARMAETEAKSDKGSIMMVLATDAPLSSRQLRRVLKRCTVGLARCGSFMGHGSGDIMIGFSTANRIPHLPEETEGKIRVLSEGAIDGLFEGAAEATEEAVLNSLAAAKPARTLDGKVIHALREFIGCDALD